ncbi:DEAD/DEAH box helicase, partial [Caldithrix abyssi]
MDQNTAERLLKIAVGNAAARFREGQWEAIDALVNQRRKLLVVQRTGWGKSLVYFISTRILRDRGGGPTIIISPLLALMRNQIEAAERIGIRAQTINSTNTKEWKE